MKRRVLLPLACLCLFGLPLGRPVLGQSPQPEFGALQARVRAANGQPLRALVCAFKQDGSHIAGMTTNDPRNPGSFMHDRVPAGLYEVEVWCPGFRPLRVYGIKVEAGKPTAFNATLAQGADIQELGNPVATDEELKQFGSLEGTVLSGNGPAPKVAIKGTRRPGGDARGRSEKYFTIVVTQNGHQTRGGGSSGTGPGPITFAGDFQYYLGGNYKIRGLVPGTYDLDVTGSEGERPKKIYGVVIKPGQRTILNAQFQPGTGVQEVRAPSVTYLEIKPLMPPTPAPKP